LGKLEVKIKTHENATLIKGDDLSDLIPKIHTQDELNEFEQANIQFAVRWAARGTGLSKDFPSDATLKFLHRKMFDKTWKWAGEFRKIELNRGVDWRKIPTEVKKLCDDAHYWIQNKTYAWDELAARFHYRLVFVHPFKNGNGRHGRLATDLLLERNGQELFTWGSQSLTEKSIVRDEYVSALKEADKGNIGRLIGFVRS
jgi:Fic-DOC domain mobile mystery protein B